MTLPNIWKILIEKDGNFSVCTSCHSDVLVFLKYNFGVASKSMIFRLIVSEILFRLMAESLHKSKLDIWENCIQIHVVSTLGRSFCACAVRRNTCFQHDANITLRLFQLNDRDQHVESFEQRTKCTNKMVDLLCFRGWALGYLLCGITF